MYAFIEQFVDLLQRGQPHYFLAFFVLVWMRWFVINTLALFYRPVKAAYRTTKTVIIPVVDEPIDVFTAVLDSITKQRPTQVIVVINGPRNTDLELLCKKYKGVESYWTKKASKRHAIEYAMKHARGNIVVLNDSDTIWEPGALSELVKPFADPRVGGVTTRQKIIDPEGSLINRICDWLEDVRAWGTMPAMSVRGKVGCLPGRTIAFRRTILVDAMPEFMNEQFLGFHKEVSDDRSLTNLTLQAGYRTVMQSTSLVYTSAPETWRKFLRQQLRWSEGSQYNNVRMSGWMLRHSPLMFFVYWTDMLLPFILWGIFGSFALRVALNFDPMPGLSVMPNSPLLILCLTLAGAYVSYGLRQFKVLSQDWRQLLYLPLYIAFLSFVLAPVRILGFARLADDMGWGTRSSGYGAKKFSRKLMPAWLIPKPRGAQDVPA